MEHNKYKNHLLKQKLSNLNINSVSSSPINIKNNKEKRKNKSKNTNYNDFKFNFPEFNSFDEKKIYNYSTKCSEGGNFPPINSPTPPDETEYMKNYYLNYIAEHQLKIQK